MRRPISSCWGLTCCSHELIISAESIARVVLNDNLYKLERASSISLVGLASSTSLVGHSICCVLGVSRDAYWRQEEHVKNVKAHAFRWQFDVVACVFVSLLIGRSVFALAPPFFGVWARGVDTFQEALRVQNVSGFFFCFADGMKEGAVRKGGFPNMVRGNDDAW